MVGGAQEESRFDRYKLPNVTPKGNRKFARFTGPGCRNIGRLCNPTPSEKCRSQQHRGREEALDLAGRMAVADGVMRSLQTARREIPVSFLIAVEQYRRTDGIVMGETLKELTRRFLAQRQALLAFLHGLVRNADVAEELLQE